jgi:hypothetical protein
MTLGARYFRGQQIPLPPRHLSLSCAVHFLTKVSDNWQRFVPVPPPIPTSALNERNACGDLKQRLSSAIEILFSFCDAAANLSPIVGKLLSGVQTHFIRPTRQREWAAQIAVPATNEKLDTA